LKFSISTSERAASSRTSACPSACAMLTVTDFLPRFAEVK